MNQIKVICWNHLAWTGISLDHQLMNAILSTERYHFQFAEIINNEWYIIRPKVISPGFQREVGSAKTRSFDMIKKVSWVGRNTYINSIYDIPTCIPTYLHTYIYTYIDTHIHTMLGWQLEAGKGSNQKEVNLIRWDLSLVFKGMDISYVERMSHQPLFMM